MNGEAIERQAADWLAKRDGSDWTAADQVALDAWLGASVANRVAMLRLEAAWERAAALRVSPDQTAREVHVVEQAVEEPVRQLVQPIELSANEGTFSRWIRRSGLPVAVGLALVLSVVVSLRDHPEQAPSTQVFEGTVGRTSDVALDDGSHLMLAPDGRAKASFSQAERRLILERGEVFLAVQPDSRRAFVVQANARRVVVVGTRFSVRVEGERLRVAVLEGRVRIESKDLAASDAVSLTPGSVALIGKDGVDVQNRSVAAIEDLLSWRQGFLVLSDTPLSEAVAEFNRFNVRQLKIVDPDIGAMPIGGRFKLANPEAFARLLELGFQVRASSDGDEIRLSAARK